MRSKILRSTALFVISGALIFGCGGSEEHQAVAQAKKPFGAGNPEMANGELEEAVRRSLDSDEQLKAAHLTVRADVTRNEVTIAGELPTVTLRKKAVELAKTAHAGVIVIDKILVKPDAAKASPHRSAHG